MNELSNVPSRLGTELIGQTALVTGAAGGIGLAITATLAAHGARIVAWDRATKKVEALGLGGDQLECADLDLTDRSEVAARCAELFDRRGVPDILVNNAGIQGPTRPIEGQTDSDWDKVIDINLTSVFSLCRAFAPAMRKKGYGRIVNIASAAGVRGLANGCAYGASKAGLIGFSMGLAKELQTDGVTVNCIAPALIDTELQAQMTESFRTAAASRIPMGRMGLANEVAEMVTWVASPACSFTTGAIFDVAGGRLTI